MRTDPIKVETEMVGDGPNVAGQAVMKVTLTCTAYDEDTPLTAKMDPQALRDLSHQFARAADQLEDERKAQARAAMAAAEAYRRIKEGLDGA